MSILEISHRSKPFEAIMASARSLVKELLGAPDNYEVIFLGGGASMGFHMVPFNYLKPNGKAAYVNTGEWAGRAVTEAKLHGNVEVVATSEDKNFSYIPKGFTIPSDADYFAAAQYYFQSNKELPKALAWVNKAIEMKGEDGFWYLRLKALVHYKLGDKKAALDAAKRSLESAKKANNLDYVKLNTDSIDDWTKK